MLKQLALLLATATLAGCTTYRSTFLDRCEGGGLVADSHCGRKGVPVALKVPTHVDVYIDETFYLLPNDDVYREVEIAAVSGGLVRNLDLRAELIETKKIFLVDFKRAAAGRSSNGLKFSGEQGLKEITGKIEDETLRDATEAFSAIAPLLGARQTAAGATTVRESKGLVSGTRVVAYRRFDLNAVDFELQVADFVDQHLQPCGVE